jgi:hypothetical protein
LVIIWLLKFWILVLIVRLLSKLSGVHKSFFFNLSLSRGRFINYFWRLRVLKWVFIIKCDLVWRVIILFLNVIILINVKIVVGMNWVVCAWYKLISLLWINHTYPIEVYMLVLVVNIWRTCKHLLVALPEFHHILCFVLLRYLMITSLGIADVNVIVLQKLLIRKRVLDISLFVNSKNMLF